MKHAVWRTSGGGNARQGLSKAVLHEPRLTAQFKGEGGLAASPVFTRDGTTFLADMSGGLVAYSPEGKEMWCKQLEGGLQATPAITHDDNYLFAATFEGYLYALHTASGEARWKTSIPSKNDPRILSDLLFLGKRQRIILSNWGYKYFAVDAQDGIVETTWESGETLYAGTAANKNETLFLLRAVWAKRKADQAVEVVRIAPTSDTPQTLYTLKPGNKPVKFMKIASTPVLSANEDILYFVMNIDEQGRLYAFSLARNEVLWEARFERHLLTTPALLPDESIAVSDLSGFVRILDPQTGTTRHKYSTQTYYLLGSPVSDGRGTVFVGDIEGKIHQIQPNGNGEVVYDAGRCIQGRPAFDPRGRLIVPCMNGFAYLFA